MVCVPGFQTLPVYEGILAGAIVPAGPTGTFGRRCTVQSSRAVDGESRKEASVDDLAERGCQSGPDFSELLDGCAAEGEPEIPVLGPFRIVEERRTAREYESLFSSRSPHLRRGRADALQPQEEPSRGEG